MHVFEGVVNIDHVRAVSAISYKLFYTLWYKHSKY